MSSIYKIHPAIGVSRLGNAPDAFFVGPEEPDAPGVEIASDDTETLLTHYKANGQIKRQAARFRVFEYDQAPGGDLTLMREITAHEAEITWTVTLVNRKAALNHKPARTNPDDPVHPASPRNPGIPVDQLIIRDPRNHSIAGKKQPAVPFDQGKFKNLTVYLGELRTDDAGRLLVLGGRGVSRSDPPGQSLPSFINNKNWHDDVSDGPVTATLTFPGQPPIAVDAPAWVVVAPPDFAPGVGGIVTLYDVALQAAYDAGRLTPAAQPSFRQHIQPVIQRASNLRWVNDYGTWNALSRNWTALANPSATPMFQQLRQAVFERVTAPGLNDFVMPMFLHMYFEQWRDGHFINDWAATPPPVQSLPDRLDHAALVTCIGANFFPGIEGSINLRDKDMYAAPFRLDHSKVNKVYPGCITEIMALPWQADFFDCSGGTWWPSQRPDIAMLDVAQIPASEAPWSDPIDSHLAMVNNFQRLGFIVPRDVSGETVFVEDERDPTFHRP